MRVRNVRSLRILLCLCLLLPILYIIISFARDQQKHQHINNQDFRNSKLTGLNQGKDVPILVDGKFPITVI